MSRPSTYQGTGTTLLEQKLLQVLEPSQPKKSSTTSTPERISWKRLTRTAFRLQ
jgi:hypothetical protein